MSEKSKNRKRSADIWTKLNTISQIVLTSLAVFGYFFTVRPIRQNQLLSENNASLISQNKALDLSNSQLLDERDRITNELTSSNNELISLRAEVAENASLYDQQIEDLEKIQNEITNIREEKVLLEQNLVNQDRRILMYSFFNECTLNTFNRKFSSSYSGYDLLANDEIDTTYIFEYLENPVDYIESAMLEYFSDNSERELSNLYSRKSLEDFEIRAWDAFHRVTDDLEFPDILVSEVEVCFSEYKYNLQRIEDDYSYKIDNAGNDIFKTSELRQERIDAISELRSLYVNKLDTIKGNNPDELELLSSIVEDIYDDFNVIFD